MSAVSALAENGGGDAKKEKKRKRSEVVGGGGGGGGKSIADELRAIVHTKSSTIATEAKVYLKRVLPEIRKKCREAAQAREWSCKYKMDEKDAAFKKDLCEKLRSEKYNCLVHCSGLTLKISWENSRKKRKVPKEAAAAAAVAVKK